MEKVHVPHENDCELYVKSFKCTDNLQESLDFFNEYGFVVYNSVYSSEECLSTRNAMWEVLENEYEGLDKNDMTTWTTGKYGMSMRGACFNPTLTKNRCNSNLNRVLQTIVSEDVMVSQDRYTIFRATRSVSSESNDTNTNSDTNTINSTNSISGSNSDSILYANYQTGPKNIHLDLNPWWYFDEKSQDGVIRGMNTLQYNDTHDFVQENNYVVKDNTMNKCHVQCILNFNDNVEADGGTILVPKHHKEIQLWCENKKNKQYLKVNAPFLTFEKYITNSSDKKKAFQKHEYDTHQELLSMASRIPMREGSVLIWNQVLFHGTSPNQQSTRCRYAQYLKAFPRGNYVNYKNKNQNFNNSNNSLQLDAYDYQMEHISRLKRRANTLLKQMILNHYFDKEEKEKDIGLEYDMKILQSNSITELPLNVIQFYCSLLDTNTIQMFGFDLLLVK